MLNQLTISELAAKLAGREVSAREAMQACLGQIARVDGKIHAFISHDAADALAQADAADRLLSQGGSGASRPLLGIPVGIKDVLANDFHITHTTVQFERAGLPADAGLYMPEPVRRSGA